MPDLSFSGIYAPSGIQSAPNSSNGPRSDIPAFEVKDCTLIVRMAGVRSAMNLRELQDRVRVIPRECLFHHFCEVQVRPTFDDPVYHNDFALWADRQLRDPVVAERLGAINPYALHSLEDLRATVLEVLDERLSEVEIIPWASRGEEFNFVQGVTTVFSSGMRAADLAEFRQVIPQLSNSSIYYHFIEARRRTPGRTDDFSAWLKMLPDPPVRLIQRLQWIDFYSFHLSALKKRIIAALETAENGETHS